MGDNIILKILRRKEHYDNWWKLRHEIFGQIFIYFAAIPSA